MFDFRYHALSLAAVLFALTLGVLIGIAIGDSTLLSSAKNGIVHNLNGELDEAHHQLETLQGQLHEEEAFAGGLYPLAVHELLSGRNIGLLFFGGSSDQISSLVRGAVARADGSVATVAAVREPLDLAAIDRAAAGTHYAELASQPALVERFGQLAGRQLVSGAPNVGKALLSRVRSSLLSAFDGQLTRLEGLVVVRADPPGQTPEQSEAGARFAAGVLAGATAAGVPAVGVELVGSEPSRIAWYKAQKISSVDDLDRAAGRAALVYALSGSHGSFGVKATADSLLPAVPGAAGASSTAGP
ncbi:MAG: copper transporter [Solirubrobacteraceae bacterium]